MSYFGHLGRQMRDEMEEHWPGDKLGQLYMGIFGLQDGHHRRNLRRTSVRAS